MGLENMTIDELEARRAAIGTEIDADGADLDALEKEARAINAELEKRRAAAAKKDEIRAKVAGGAGETRQRMIAEPGKKLTLDEVRASKEYVNAYAGYLKTGKDEEVRALMTENAPTDGTIPVPTYVEGRIRTAWERLGLMSLVRKTYIKGNLTVGFEKSATDAEVHEEGTTAPEEEKLEIGKVTIIPKMLKKWIRVSDEVMELSGQEFLDYIFDELAYKIAQLEQRELLSDIQYRANQNQDPEVPTIEIEGAATATATIVAELLSKLSDEAANPVIVMNRESYAAFKAVQANAHYAYDPFEGLPVHFDSSLSKVGGRGIWLIVGDFGVGALANYPGGEDIKIKIDDLSEAEADLVKIVGRRYVGLGVVAPKAFAVAKAINGGDA